MKPETAQKKLAALLGLEPPTAPSSDPVIKHSNATRSREAEAVIDYIATPYRYRKETCRVCRREFAVDRSNVACCSDKCRADELAKIGIIWDWSKDPSERWILTGKKTAEPLVVPPEVLPLAMEAARNQSAGSPKTQTPEPPSVDIDDLLDPTSLGAHLL